MILSSLHGLPQSASPHHRVLLRGVLRSLTFDFSAELHAPWTVLFGVSGSGKSTLLHAMCGTLQQAQASRLSGTRFSRRESSNTWTDLTGNSPESRALAYAPQAASLFPHLSVRQNVGFGAESQFGPSSLVEEACELFELGGLWHRMPAKLSGGEQQRVNLARAFARPDSRLMLLDEPFTGMDRALRDRLLARLRPALAARGLPVLSVTHDVEEAFLLDADVLRLVDGRSAEQGPADHVLLLEAGQIRAALNRQTSVPK